MSAPGIRLAFVFSRTYAIYRAHLGMILAVAGGVTATVELILGLGLGELSSGYRTSVKPGEYLARLAAVTLVTSPLITAMVSRAVLDMVAGEQPSARRSVRCGLDAFAPVLLATVLWIAAIAAGFFALVVPGIYVSVSWYFVAQAVVIDQRRGRAALARSGELVRGHWMRAALTGLAFQLAVAIPDRLASLVFGAIAREADAAAILVLGDIVVQAFTLPFVAIAATLFYLDLRGEAAGAPALPGA